MDKLRRDFMLRNGLYKWGDKISAKDYESLSPENQSNYVRMANDDDAGTYRLPDGKQKYERADAQQGAWYYRQIIPEELTAEKVMELCALEQAENAAKSEKHLRTIKNIVIFLLALDVISALILLVSNFVR